MRPGGLRSEVGALLFVALSGLVVVPADDGCGTEDSPSAPVKATVDEIMDVGDWAEVLAEKSEEGVFDGGGNVLVVAMVNVTEDERLSEARLRVKFRAVQMVRSAWGISKTLNVSYRFVYGDMMQDGVYVGVLAFSRDELQAAKDRAGEKGAME